MLCMSAKYACPCMYVSICFSPQTSGSLQMCYSPGPEGPLEPTGCRTVTRGTQRTSLHPHYTSQQRSPRPPPPILWSVLGPQIKGLHTCQRPPTDPVTHFRAPTPTPHPARPAARPLIDTNRGGGRDIGSLHHIHPPKSLDHVPPNAFARAPSPHICARTFTPPPEPPSGFRPIVAWIGAASRAEACPTPPPHTRAHQPPLRLRTDTPPSPPSCVLSVVWDIQPAPYPSNGLSPTYSTHLLACAITTSNSCSYYFGDLF